VIESGASGAATPIVVAVSATRRCGETLEMAAAFATNVGADLEVVLVEDADLLRLADLPVTREVDRASGVTRELDSTRIERALQSEARRLRYQLTRIRRATSIRSTVRVVRGRFLSAAMAASASVDVTFVHDAKRTLPGGHRPGTLVGGESVPAGPGSGRPPRLRKPVSTLFEGGPASVRALQVAAKLAQALGCGLMVLIPQRGADETASARREARAAVGEAGLRFLEVAENRSLLQERILAPGSSGVLVLAKQSRELEDSVTRDYLESLAVPLVLVA
jgi:hypothetical protein